MLRSHPRQILLAAGVMAGISVGTYLTITYSISFAGSAGVEHWKVLLAIPVSNVLQLVTVPLAGALSDRFGHRPVFLTGIGIWAVPSIGFLTAVSTGNLALVLIAYLVPYGIGYALPQGATPAMFAEAFDSRVGYSGISLGSQLGNLVGGFAPFVAALVVAAIGSTLLGVCVGVLLLLAGLSATALVRLGRAAPQVVSRADDGARPAGV